MIDRALSISVISVLAMSSAAHAEESRWAGPYVGVQATHLDSTAHDTANPAAVEKDLDGWFGGAQAGYNLQLDDSIVVGVEADIAFGNARDKWFGRDSNEFDTYYTKDSIGTYGTVRARAGYATDSALIYITSGLAIAETEHVLGCDRALVALTLGCAANGGSFETKKSETRTGFVVGGGAELAVTPNISVKAEYNYIDYGKGSVDLVDPNYPGSLTERQFELDSHIIKAGINYSF